MKTAIGLMSGTSMDGIDVALIRTDGEAALERGPSREYAYSLAQRRRLEEGVTAALAENAPDDPLLSSEIAFWHVEAVRRFLADVGVEAAEVDVIGFHGHTLVHRPWKRFTLQSGDGSVIAKAFGCACVYDFRSADVAAGGQGAPLVPSYHDALARGAGLARPVAFLNIGGVANVTLLRENGPPLAFDTGPGNMLLDRWMQAHAGIPYDAGGRIASEGGIVRGWLDEQLARPWFGETGPKSLDRFDFRLPDISTFALADGARTLTRLTAEAVARAEELLPDAPHAWIVCGGGRQNDLLMGDLRDCLSAPVETAEDHGLDGGAMEAEAFAYLAVRALDGRHITWPSTTGVSEPMAGGVVAWP